MRIILLMMLAGIEKAGYRPGEDVVIFPGPYGLRSSTQTVNTIFKSQTAPNAHHPEMIDFMPTGRSVFQSFP